MSISRKSSYATFVVEKSGKDPLQFLGNTEHLRADLDLQGLSDAARKPFATLKLWQRPVSCWDNPIVPTIVNKIADRVDECAAAIKTTLGAAKMGRAFAENMAAMSGAVAKGEDVSELLSKSIAIAEKGYGRSIQAHGQLICIRSGLTEVADNIPSQVAKVELEKKAETPAPAPGLGFTGLNHCFVSIEGPPAADTNNDDVDTWSPDAWNPVGFQPWNGPTTSYLSFQSVIEQLKGVITDVTPFIERVNRSAVWWSEMKVALESLKVALADSAPGSLPGVRAEAAEGWKGVADQFALYICKTGSIVSSVFPANRLPVSSSTPWAPCPPSPYMPYVSPAPPIRPRRRRSNRSFDSVEDLAVPVPAQEKKASLWRRILCMA